MAGMPLVGRALQRDERLGRFPGEIHRDVLGSTEADLENAAVGAVVAVHVVVVTLVLVVPVDHEEAAVRPGT